MYIQEFNHKIQIFLIIFCYLFRKYYKTKNRLYWVFLHSFSWFSLLFDMFINTACIYVCTMQYFSVLLIQWTCPCIYIFSTPSILIKRAFLLLRIDKKSREMVFSFVLFCWNNANYYKNLFFYKKYVLALYEENKNNNSEMRYSIYSFKIILKHVIVEYIKFNLIVHQVNFTTTYPVIWS